MALCHMLFSNKGAIWHMLFSNKGAICLRLVSQQQEMEDLQALPRLQPSDVSVDWKIEVKGGWRSGGLEVRRQGGPEVWRSGAGDKHRLQGTDYRTQG